MKSRQYNTGRFPAPAICTRANLTVPKVHIEDVFPFEKAGAMLDRLGSRQVEGKLILAVNPS